MWLLLDTISVICPAPPLALVVQAPTSTLGLPHH